jgi:hypothetical protein
VVRERMDGERRMMGVDEKAARILHSSAQLLLSPDLPQCLFRHEMTPQPLMSLRKHNIYLVLPHSPEPRSYVALKPTLFSPLPSGKETALLCPIGTPLQRNCLDNKRINIYAGTLSFAQRNNMYRKNSHNVGHLGRRCVPSEEQSADDKNNNSQIDDYYQDSNDDNHHYHPSREKMTKFPKLYGGSLCPPHAEH